MSGSKLRSAKMDKANWFEPVRFGLGSHQKQEGITTLGRQNTQRNPSIWLIWPASSPPMRL
jgi:hypothetical protein